MAGVAGLLTEDPSISRALARTVEHLRELQGAEGQIASNHELRDGQPPRVSFGTLVPRIDAASWYIIRVALCVRAGLVDRSAFVGPQEVNVALLQSHVAAFRAGDDGIVVPRVNHPTDSFQATRMDFAPIAVLVVEGTYALHLVAADVRIFLDATHGDTRERPRVRNRDIDAPIVDQIFDIEHAIIRSQRDLAGIVVDRGFNVRR